jgi:hypothetical protein
MTRPDTTGGTGTGGSTTRPDTTGGTGTGGSTTRPDTTWRYGHGRYAGDRGHWHGHRDGHRDGHGHRDRHGWHAAADHRWKHHDSPATLIGSRGGADRAPIS